MSRMGEALRPVVARAAEQARKAIMSRTEGKFFPVPGVNVYFEVGTIGGPKGPWTLRPRGLVAEMNGVDYVFGSPGGDELGTEFADILARAVEEGPETLASAWEANMMMLLDAGVSREDLLLAVEEALARSVMES